MARKKVNKKAPVKRTAAKKSTAKKNKVSKLSQAHGKEEKFAPTTLDQIWGDDGTSKYGTTNEDEYKLRLNDFSRSDLHAHAVKIGLIPIDNSEVLKKRLLTEFKKYVATYAVVPLNENLNKPISKKAMKILEEGK